MSISGAELVGRVRNEVACIAPAEAPAFLQGNPGAVIVDVREPAEHSAAALRNAVHIPRGVLEFKISEHCSAEDAPLLLHCAGGGRAILAARMLAEMGYTNVRAVAGSFEELAAALEPTTG